MNVAAPQVFLCAPDCSADTASAVLLEGRLHLLQLAWDGKGSLSMQVDGRMSDPVSAEAHATTQLQLGSTPCSASHASSSKPAACTARSNVWHMHVWIVAAWQQLMVEPRQLLHAGPCVEPDNPWGTSSHANGALPTPAASWQLPSRPVVGLSHAHARLVRSTRPYLPGSKRDNIVQASAAGQAGQLQVFEEAHGSLLLAPMSLSEAAAVCDEWRALAHAHAQPDAAAGSPTAVAQPARKWLSAVSGLLSHASRHPRQMLESSRTCEQSTDIIIGLAIVVTVLGAVNIFQGLLFWMQRRKLCWYQRTLNSCIAKYQSSGSSINVNSKEDMRKLGTKGVCITHASCSCFAHQHRCLHLFCVPFAGHVSCTWCMGGWLVHPAAQAACQLLCLMCCQLPSVQQLVSVQAQHGTASSSADTGLCVLEHMLHVLVFNTLACCASQCMHGLSVSFQLSCDVACVFPSDILVQMAMNPSQHNLHPHQSPRYMPPADTPNASMPGHAGVAGSSARQRQVLNVWLVHASRCRYHGTPHTGREPAHGEAF